MLFISSSLAMNGGSTFLIRICKEMVEKGQKVGVLILFNNIDEQLKTELSKHASIYLLKDFFWIKSNLLFKNQLGIFWFLNKKKIFSLLNEYAFNVHVMGVFGLIFFKKIEFLIQKKIKLSVGIYHQNEFLFSASNHYFTKYVKREFKELDSSQIIFFNENNVKSYSLFFNKNFDKSSILPIGIDLKRGQSQEDVRDNFNSKKIISIGNLVPFKTYNFHVINLLSQSAEFNDFEYHIYGDGESYPYLKELIKKNKLERRVFFHGKIRYEEIERVLADAFLFVGSGTAIIEASSYGVPSIVGIESVQAPVTSGYFSEVVGYSYNELIDGQDLFTIEEKIKNLKESRGNWLKIGKQCRDKASEFSISRTADGFIFIHNNLKKIEQKNKNNFYNSKLLISFILCAIMHVLKINRSFYNRRTEGTIA